MPVGSIDTVLNCPVVKPFCVIEVTPKPPPNCVLWEKSKVMLMGETAPSVGAKPGKVSAPEAGGVTAPVLEKVSVFVVGSSVPPTVMLTFHVLATPVCVK